MWKCFPTPLKFGFDSQEATQAPAVCVCWSQDVRYMVSANLARYLVDPQYDEVHSALSRRRESQTPRKQSDRAEQQDPQQLGRLEDPDCAALQAEKRNPCTPVDI